MMTRDQAASLIRNTFENPFDRERFGNFAKNLLNHIKETPQTVYCGNFIPVAFRSYVKTMGRVGKYEDSTGKKLDILVVHLKRETSLIHARTTQRNFIAWYLAGSRGGVHKDAALVAFVSPDETDWRFSLVKMEYQLAQKPDGRTRAERILTPARRYSFLVGPNEGSHTAQAQLIDILADDEHNPTLADLEKAFSVERVTREFFTEYRDLFLRVKDALDGVLRSSPKVKREFADKRINTVDFAKKLLGQLVFLYFLQKKGWFGVRRDAEWGTGPKDFLRRLFCSKIADDRNFFNDILEPLFYEALRVPRTDDYYSRFDCKIPFLNGGLFDPIREYDWVHADVHLPNELFSNSKRTTAGDTGTGILDVFDRYNFTVNEEEPLEKEVAIDPELLGKLYEKFNAINAENYSKYCKALTARRPDLERKFNHKYGVHYTPREIVQAMCKESLLEYLFSKLQGSVPRAHLDMLVTNAEKLAEHEVVAQARAELVAQGKQKTSGRYPTLVPDSIRKNAGKIDQALDELRVCDPAVGSGAFLVGMMKELVAVRMALDCLTGTRPRKRYDLKRHAIEKSLYGVDIDPGAVEIARLRLWLSLVVDEEDRKDILPLPNLDFRIAAGDSLLGVPYRSIGLGEVEALKATLFNETDAENRRELKQRIDQALANCYAASGRQLGHEVRFDLKIVFSEVFPDKSDAGFDIVIANPPYIRQEGVLQGFGATYKKTLTLLYPETMVRTADIYVAFYARAHQLLRPNGIGCFISSNKWLRAAYGEKLRQHLLDKQRFLLVIDFGELPVFETAATFPGIFLWQKQPRNGSPTHWAVVKDLDKCYNEGVREHIRRIGISVPASQFGAGKPRLAAPDIADIRRKMEAAGPRLGGLVKGQILYGVKTGLNEAFIIDRATRDRLIGEDPKSEEIIKPLVVGDDVRRYEIHFRENYLIWTYIGVPIKQYPAVFKHLKRFQTQAEKRWDKGEHWWELRACDYYPAFERPKIMYPEIAKDARFVLDFARFFPNKTSFSIPCEDWYLLAVLNSDPGWRYLGTQCSVLGDENAAGRLTLQKVFVEELPIPDAMLAERERVARLARRTQELHEKRRKRVEKFLRDIGTSPAESSSRNMLEYPWDTDKCTDDYFRRKARDYPLKLLHDVRDETIALTEEIQRIEAEIDDRVKALYGL